MTQDVRGGADPEWFRRYYGDDYAASVRDSLDADRTDRETDFLISLTGVARGAHVVDLGCGEGRHALALAGRGMRVTAVDLNRRFLERGRRDALRQDLDVQWLHGDMRTPRAGPFDLALLLFHSFGFFSDAENAQLLRDWGRELEPAGGFVIDVWNRERILRDFVPRAERTVGDLAVLEERDWDGATGRLQVRYRYHWHGKPARSYEASFRLYGKGELEVLLEEAGFGPSVAYGSLTGDSWRADAPRLVLFARRARDTG